jgi:hypothetical protein
VHNCYCVTARVRGWLAVHSNGSDFLSGSDSETRDKLVRCSKTTSLAIYLADHSQNTTEGESLPVSSQNSIV